MSQASKNYHDIINEWRRRQFKISAYRHMLEQELDPAKEEWDAAFDAMTALEAMQEENKAAVLDARCNTSTIY